MVETAAFSSATSTTADKRLLPALRDDLVLHRGPHLPDGSPSWTLQDAAANRFFSLDYVDHALLAHWKPGLSVSELAAIASRDLPYDVTEGRAEELLVFLARNRLLRPASVSGWRSLALQARHRAAAQTLGRQLLHHYLFFRIPIWRPDRFLAATEPFIRPFFSRGAFVIALIAGLLGLGMVLRQWDNFVHSFNYFFSWSGAASYGLTLFLAKVVHEMGHAWTARRYGIPVPSIGIAVMVLWPMLYTDAGHVWRLRSRKARLHISAAGVAAETILAAYALLLWNLLPDGMLRNATFLLATTAWFMTLAINLNPLMRFDGYYMLSDLLGIDNLQERSFALGRWYIRYYLLGFDDDCPEDLPVFQRRLLAVYAYACWVYRLILFLGIALLVYHFIVKIVGIFLMAVEIGWFILRPLWMEARIWWQRRHDITRSGHLKLLLMGCILLMAILIPWGNIVEAPAVLRPMEVRLYASESAILQDRFVSIGQRVKTGDTLLLLKSPDLEHRIAQASSRLEALEQRAARLLTDPRYAQGRGQLAEERARLAAELQALQARQAQLTITAPMDGTIASLAEGLSPERWLAARTPLMVVADSNNWTVRAYAEESDLARLAPDAKGRFFPDSGTGLSPALQIAEIDMAGAGQLEEQTLASPYGGKLAANRMPDGRLALRDGIYRLRLTVTEPVSSEAMAIPGTVALSASSRSLASIAATWVMNVLLRESGID